MANSCSIDYLVVGQGIAGSVLAYKLLARGHSVRIIDNGHRTSATKIAAGMVNPVTGKRLTKTPDALLASAKAFYREVEVLSGEKIFHELPIQRMIRNKNARTRYLKRKDELGYAEYLGELQAPGGFASIGDAAGSFAIHQGGRVDAVTLLSLMRAHFAKAGALIEDELAYDELKVTAENAQWRGETFGTVIFCDGMRIMANPYFSKLATDPVKGEILQVNFESSIPQTILSKGKWLLPIGENIARLGATYDRSSADCEPTEEGKAALLEELQDILPERNDATVTGHVAGIRVCSPNSQPLIGRHPEHPNLALFNGFGSKGNSLVPWWADVFTDYLQSGESLPHDVNLLRAWNKPPKNASQ